MAKTKTNETTKRDVQNETRKGGERSQAVQRRPRYETSQSHSPASLMRRFNEEMDRVLQNLGLGQTFSVPDIDLFGERQGSSWTPQVEVIERGDELIVRADLPGMTKDDVKVDVSDDRLVISGERRNEHEKEDDGYYRSERYYGSFYRTVPLPDGVDTETAEATFRNGVLEISMVAPERAGRRRLQIRGEEQAQPKAQAKAAGQR